MNKLEPTYLRYVYDELGRGSLSSDNASSLPHGFIGLFEKEFSSDIPISQRSSTLRRLCLWALLKKAVSSEFVSEVLKENTDSTKALIDTYSKWFNSPEPGKYVLFHDRLRSYLIQKLSDHEVQEINDKDNSQKIISYLKVLDKKLSKSDFIKYCLDQFKYLSNEEALSFYNSNNKDFDKTIFSNRVSDLLNNKKINMVNHFAFSNSFFLNNRIVEKCITKTLDASIHNDLLFNDDIE